MIDMLLVFGAFLTSIFTAWLVGNSLIGMWRTKRLMASMAKSERDLICHGKKLTWSRIMYVPAIPLFAFAALVLLLVSIDLIERTLGPTEMKVNVLLFTVFVLELLALLPAYVGLSMVTPHYVVSRKGILVSPLFRPWFLRFLFVEWRDIEYVVYDTSHGYFALGLSSVATKTPRGKWLKSEGALKKWGLQKEGKELEVGVGFKNIGFFTYMCLQMIPREKWNPADGALQRAYTLSYKEGHLHAPARI